MGLQMIMYGLSILGDVNHPNCEKAWTLLEKVKKTARVRDSLGESFDEPISMWVW